MRTRMVLAATVALALAGLLPAAPASAAPTDHPRCTIRGTGHADRIVGTAHRDVICAGGGDDVIDGRGGNDVIYAGSGDDRIVGGTGNDVIDAGSGADVVRGGTGNDRITADSGRDRIDAGSGADAVDAGSGADTVTAGPGNDRVTGGTGNDRIAGDSGDDVLAGGAGNDVLAGGTGDDTISPGAGANRIVAGRGDDRIDAGSGSTSTCADAYGNASSCHPTIDRPSATEITLDRTIIDTGLSPQTVHVRTRVRDDAADVARADFTVRLSTGGGPTIFTRLTRTSSTARDGYWEGDVVVPKLAPAGDYDLWVSANDVAKRAGGGSRQHKPHPGADDGPDTLRQIGLGDQAPPVFRSIDLDRTAVDTSTAAQDIAVRAHITDDLLGADGATVDLVWIDPRSTNDHPLDQRASASLALTDGSKVDGWWTGTIHMPQNSAQGTWSVAATTHDALGFRSVGASSSAAVPGPASVQQVGAVHVVAHLTDDVAVSGARLLADPDLSDPGTPRPNTQCMLQLTAGTVRDGTWECDITVSPGDVNGEYRLIAVVSDAAGNSTYGYLDRFPGWSGQTTLDVTAS